MQDIIVACSHMFGMVTTPTCGAAFNCSAARLSQFYLQHCHCHVNKQPPLQNQLLSASKGEEVWSSTLEDAAAEGTHKQLLVQQDGEGGGAVITLVAYTPG